jgi:hypothetical protein
MSKDGASLKKYKDQQHFLDTFIITFQRYMKFHLQGHLAWPNTSLLHFSKNLALYSSELFIVRGGNKTRRRFPS